MADSKITKKALATALKALMEEKPFEKINISDICERCDMNRKSFYYHFRDKYDLVNWIFDTEFIAIARKKEYDTYWKLIEDICEYFYSNHNFYRKALSVQGQNSFAEHFRELLLPVIKSRMAGQFISEKSTDFQIQFFSDALVMAFQRWIEAKDPLTPEEFMIQSKVCVQYLSKRFNELNNEMK